MANNDRENRDVLEHIEAEVHAVKSELEIHIEEERPILEALGDPEEIRNRIAFINLWIEREQDKAKLRKAIIEKTVIGAIWALCVFVGLAVFNEVRDIVVSWRGK